MSPRMVTQRVSVNASRLAVPPKRVPVPESKRPPKGTLGVANDTIYGLNASVFTNDVNRAREVAAQLRSGTVGHNAFRTDFGIAFGGFKQSGIGREGGIEGLRNYLEVKTVILEGRPAGYEEKES